MQLQALRNMQLCNTASKSTSTIFKAEQATCSTISMLPLSSEGPAPPRLLPEGRAPPKVLSVGRRPGVDCVLEVALACTRGTSHQDDRDIEDLAVSDSDTCNSRRHEGSWKAFNLVATEHLRSTQRHPLTSMSASILLDALVSTPHSRRCSSCTAFPVRILMGMTPASQGSPRACFCFEGLVRPRHHSAWHTAGSNTQQLNCKDMLRAGRQGLTAPLTTFAILS